MAAISRWNLSPFAFHLGLGSLGRSYATLFCLVQLGLTARCSNRECGLQIPALTPRALNKTSEILYQKSDSDIPSPYSSAVTSSRLCHLVFETSWNLLKPLALWNISRVANLETCTVWKHYIPCIKMLSILIISFPFATTIAPTSLRRP